MRSEFVVTSFVVNDKDVEVNSFVVEDTSFVVEDTSFVVEDTSFAVVMLLTSVASVENKDAKISPFFFSFSKGFLYSHHNNSRCLF